MSLKQLHQLGEVCQRPGQTVDLVENHDVNFAQADISQQRLHRRAFQSSSGDAAIVVAGLDQSPALVGLALDVSLGSLALSIKGVEVLFEAVLGGLAGIDRAAKGLAFVSCHCPPLMMAW